MIQDTCHCCELPEPATPVVADNRPVLSAIVFRVGDFNSFRQAMLQAIAGTPELTALSSRVDEDYAITVMELWAIVADVLTFYQERIANEGFLRTARLRDSLLRLVRLLDYQLAPGVAATALAAFTVEKDRTVRIPIGLRIQSVPGQDQKPQKYETVESFTATSLWNKLRILPAPVAVNPLGRGNTRALLVPGAEGLAIANLLWPGLKIVLFNDAASTPVEELAVKTVAFTEDRIDLQWNTPIQQNVWGLATNVRPFNRIFRVFGYNAPVQFMRATPPVAPAISIKWSLVSLTAADYQISGTQILLDSRWDNIRTGTKLLIAFSGGARVFTVTAVDQIAGELGSLKDTVTRVTLGGALPTSDRRSIRLYELQEPDIKFWGLSYPDRLNAAIVHLPGRRLAGNTIEVGRIVAAKGVAAGVTIDLAAVDKGRRVILRDATTPAIAGRISASSLFGADITFSRTVADSTTVRQLGFDAAHAKPVTGLATDAFGGVPVITNPKREMSITIGSIGPRLVALSAAPASLTILAASLETAINAADGDVLFFRARVRLINSRLVIVPGLAGAAVIVRPSPNDPTTATELGFDPDKSRALAGISSASLPSAPVLINPAREMAVTIGAFGPRTIVLPVSPATLTDAASKLQIALNSADPSPLFASAKTTVVDDRIVVFPGPVGEEIQEFLRLEIKLDAGARFDSASAVLFGNVAESTHGETVADEILGDGDASQKFRKFTLENKSLTYAPSANEAGMESSLQVFVNRTLWRETPTLFGTAPSDTIYTSRIADDGTVTVQFGDGNNGALLPTGRANVVATYRQGTGLEGRVAEGQLRTPLDLPVGLKSVINPMPAEGGGDPETLALARRNAPATVKTFRRAVSLRDFEDLASARADVAKARATWVWDGESRAIHLTLAGEQAGTFSPAALALIHASLDLQRDRNYKLLPDNFVRVPVVVTALVRVVADRIASDIAAAARAALLDALSFDTLAFGAPVHLSDLYAVLQDVDGVDSVDIDLFHFKDRSAANLALRGATIDPVQRRLVVFEARSNTAPPPLVLPAEQAWIESPNDDVTIVTSGGLPG